PALFAIVERTNEPIRVSRVAVAFERQAGAVLDRAEATEHRMDAARNSEWFAVHPGFSRDPTQFSESRLPVRHVPFPAGTCTTRVARPRPRPSAGWARFFAPNPYGAPCIPDSTAGNPFSFAPGCFHTGAAYSRGMIGRRAALGLLAWAPWLGACRR